MLSAGLLKRPPSDENANLVAPVRRKTAMSEVEVTLSSDDVAATLERDKSNSKPAPSTLEKFEDMNKVEATPSSDDAAANVGKEKSDARTTLSGIGKLKNMNQMDATSSNSTDKSEITNEVGATFLGDDGTQNVEKRDVEHLALQTTPSSSDCIDSSDEDEENRIKKFKRQRDRIKQTKQDILEKLAIVEYTQEIADALAVAKKENRSKVDQTTKNSSKRRLGKRKASPLPRRLSLRLQKKDPTDLPPEPEAPVYINPRRPGDEFPMNVVAEFEVKGENIEELNQDEQEEIKDYADFMSSLANIGDVPDYSENAVPSPTVEKFKRDLKLLKTRPDHIERITMFRIFSLAMHPSITEVLIAVGDKKGNLGLWRPLHRDKNDGVYVFKPHIRPINCLKFSSYDSKLYTCSYDGQLRAMDLERNVFDKALIDSADSGLSSFDFLHGSSSLVASHVTGNLSIVDPRASPKENSVNTFNIHNRRVKCVSVHPLQQHYVVTSHDNGSVYIFDIRGIRKRCRYTVELKGHSRVVNSAYFSPVSGQNVLTSSHDNHLRIFDTSVITGKIKQKSSCYHNNETGRWLCSLRTEWHPRSDQVFVVGSMNQPRQIDFYDDSATQLHTLTHQDLRTVCSINCFHSSRNILAGGDAAGRVYFFSDGL